MCGVLDQTVECNVQSCDRDCTLSEWSEWSECSRQCRAAGAEPGHEYRMQAVKRHASGGGQCPSRQARTEKRECNAALCRGNVSCTGGGDVVLVLDGSGSIQGPAANDQQIGQADASNFVALKAFAEGLIKRSTLSEDSAGVDGLRYGGLVFGDKPVVFSTLSGKRQALADAMGKAVWQGGQTSVAPALEAAQELFNLAGPDDSRTETVVLVTDGQLEQPRAAVAAAKELRATGSRVLVVLVQGDDKYDERTNTLCEIVGEPCKERVLSVKRWTDLVSELDGIAAAVCPTAS